MSGGDFLGESPLLVNGCRTLYHRAVCCFANPASCFGESMASLARTQDGAARFPFDTDEDAVERRQWPLKNRRNCGSVH